MAGPAKYTSILVSLLWCVLLGLVSLASSSLYRDETAKSDAIDAKKSNGEREDNETDIVDNFCVQGRSKQNISDSSHKYGCSGHLRRQFTKMKKMP